MAAEEVLRSLKLQVGTGGTGTGGHVMVCGGGELVLIMKDLK